MTDDLDDLTRALRAVAADDAQQISVGVEEQLLAEVRAMRPRRQILAPAHWVGLAMAAALVAALAVPLWIVARGTIPSTARMPPPPHEVTTAFLPLAFSTVPATDAQTVRLAVPRSAIASLGLLPIDDAEAISGASGAILADVIVGEDGLARAVRFVRKSQD